MFRHGPSCLVGPVRRDPDWWAPDTEAASPEATSTMEPPASQPRPEPDRPIRKELVERVRREIAEGTYDTPEKWEIALDRLFKRLEGGD